MTVITIGRNPDSNIVINDNMVSRNHAILKISPTGKCEIVSMGPNGTTVNGNPISPNQPYPLKRGDMVVFAGHARLDWSKVPNPLKPLMIGAIVFGVIAIAIVAVLLINNFRSSSNVYEGGSTPVDFVENDNVSKDKEAAVERTESDATAVTDDAVLPGSDVPEMVADDSDDPIAAELNAHLKEQRSRATGGKTTDAGKTKADKKKGKGSNAETKEVKAEKPKAEEPKVEEAKAEEPKPEPKAEEPAPAANEEPAEPGVPNVRF